MLVWKRVGRDDHGDVVASAAIEGELHELRAGVGGRGRSCQRLRDRVVIDQVGQPVAAEEQAVAVLETQEIDVDIDVLVGAAERVRENVPRAETRGCRTPRASRSRRASERRCDPW